MRMVARRLMALLDRALPSAVAEDVIGDLLEGGPVSLREVVRTAWYLGPIALRHLVGPDPALPIAGALVGAVLSLGACGAWWRYVLFLVPLRADHAPGVAMAALGTLTVMMCGAVGFGCARAAIAARTASGTRALRCAATPTSPSDLETLKRKAESGA